MNFIPSPVKVRKKCVKGQKYSQAISELLQRCPTFLILGCPFWLLQIGNLKCDALYNINAMGGTH